MTPGTRQIAGHLLAAFLMALPVAAPAQTWSGATNTLWSVGGNWVGGIAPASANTTFITFAFATGTLASAVDAPWTINRLDVNLPVRTLTGSPLTFDGVSPQLNVIDVGHSIANDLVLAATLTVTNTDPLTLPGGITGPGGLTVAGPGSLTLAGPGFHNGTTTINAGATLTFTGSPTIIDVVDNGALELGVPGGVAITNPVVGTGTVAVISDQALGTFNHLGPTSVAPAAQLDGAVDNAALLSLDGTMNTGGSTVGSLAGNGLLNINGGLFTVGADNTSTLFAGNVAGTGDLTKVGAGTLTLASDTLNNGTITVNGGTLEIGDGVTAPLAAITVVTNAALEVNTTAAGTAFTDPVNGSGTVAITGGTAVANLLHAGATTVAAGARLDGGILNSAAFTLDGEFNTGGSVVGSLAGAATGLLNINSGTLTVGLDGSSTTYLGQVAGIGNLDKVGGGRLTLAGSSLNFGTIMVSGGTLAIGNGATGPGTAITIVNNAALELQVPLPPGLSITNVVVGTGSVSMLGGLTVGQFQHTGTTSIAAGAELAGGITNNALLTLDGTLNTGGTTVGSLAGAPSGTLNINSGTFATGGDGTNATFAGTINGAGALVKNGAGQLILTGNNTYIGTTTAANGLLAITGTHMSPTSVTGGATLLVTGSIFNPVDVTLGLLGGTGTITFPVTVAAGGTLAPGLGAGIINIGGTLTLAGTLASEILGPTPGAQHDQVNLIGGVVLNNATLALSGGYVPIAGNVFVLIANDGADPVVGTFAGLPEGATLTFNGVTLRISYAGGDGNDVVLAVATYTVTPSAGPNGSIAPNTPQTVAHGATATFTLTPSPGYTAVVLGSCGGMLVGNTYTTNAITAACTVDATFTLNTYTVTPSAGPNGSIAPNTPQTIGHGATTVFTVTPNAGYNAVVGGTCGGALVGTTYTTNTITASCTVDATFTASAITSFTGPTATGTGNATASFTGGGPACTFATAQFIPLTGHAASPPTGSAPATIAFPHGLFDFTLNNCTPGSTITMTIVYPATLAPGTQYWKYGPEPGNATAHWYVMPATIAGNNAVIGITDGQQGDDDLTANGTIVDQGGPGNPPAGAGAIQTPTMSQWMLLLLATLMLAMGWARKAAGRSSWTRSTRS